MANNEPPVSSQCPPDGCVDLRTPWSRSKQSYRYASWLRKSGTWGTASPRLRAMRPRGHIPKLSALQSSTKQCVRM